MAIQFARCEYVSRSQGGNVCRKASYNQREEIRCERTGELFSFKDRGGNVHHEIFLPEGIDEKFKNSSVLWNEVERCEKRKDSQLQKEFVLALPDDPQVTLEDRIELTRRFARDHFIEKGLGVQVDIHDPDESEKNWHAHLLVTTRRFSEDGLSFEKTKARDLDPTIRKGFVVEADVWGELWRDLQNTYFEEKGYDLRVDPIGVLVQEHLGPVRMRHHMNEAILRSQMLQKANQELAKDPGNVLEALTRNQAVFSQRELEIFLKKHVPVEERGQIFEKVLSHPTVLPLYDKETGNATGSFTTREVRAEEEKLIRFTDAIAKKSTPCLAAESTQEKTLSEEQQKAYELCVTSGQNLSLVQGRAGVGKSYVLNAIREAHEENGYRVLGLAPTHKVATDLRESGFKEAKTCHAFLFAFKNGRENLHSNTLVVVDEAGMLGTELSVELFHAVKTSGAKLILVGDDRQLSSVDRGGVFKTLADRYESVELKDVRRQIIDWHKRISEDLSKGDIKSAVYLLQEKDCIDWKESKEEALTELLKVWAKDSQIHPHETRQILAQKNVDVDVLNQGVRDILRSQGKLGEVELTCMTQRGKMAFATGDRIQLTKTDKNQELINGHFGVIERLSPKTIAVYFDNGEKKEIDPSTYDGLRHGYASTVYKAQGSTLDHVYVLHSQTTNKATNYVALTRQTKSLSLFVSKDETPHEVSLIRQMSRDERKGTSLAFDTQKDLTRRQEEKSLKTRLRDGVENIATKVKDAFHKNEAFYRIEKSLPPQTNPSLQAVYEDWKHPAFKQADHYKRVFAEGLKLHGEEAAIQYWQSRREPFLELYEKKLETVGKELQSSVLSYLSDESRKLTFEAAREDPDKALKLLASLQEARKGEEMAKEKAPQAHQEKASTFIQNKRNKKDFGKEFREALSAYYKFKELKYEVKHSPDPDDVQKELHKIGKGIFNNKEAFAHIESLDPNIGKAIKQAAQEKVHSHELNLSRGGISL